MEARTEDRRGRGRPREGYMGYMNEIDDIARKTGKRVEEMKRVAKNREDWWK